MELSKIPVLGACAVCCGAAGAAGADTLCTGAETGEAGWAAPGMPDTIKFACAGIPAAMRHVAAAPFKKKPWRIVGDVFDARIFI